LAKVEPENHVETDLVGEIGKLAAARAEVGIRPGRWRQSDQ
jgi:hypothetical protein